MKREGRRRASARARKLALVRRMYRNTDLERERLELARLKVELDQLKSERNVQKAEAKSETFEKITDMARSSAETNQKDQAKVSGMARTQMRR